jgi:hypothetical protein
LSQLLSTPIQIPSIHHQQCVPIDRGSFRETSRGGWLDRWTVQCGLPVYGGEFW